MLKISFPQYSSDRFHRMCYGELELSLGFEIVHGSLLFLNDIA